MRRTIAGTAVSLIAALAIVGPLAPASRATPAALECVGPDSAACALLDDLAAQLGPIAPLLGTGLAPLTGDAQGLATQSEQPGGVPVAEVVAVSEALLDQLAVLPGPVQTLIGATQLGEVTDTLEAILVAVSATASDPQESAGGSTATPAKAAPSSAAPSAGARSGASSAGGSSASTGGSTSTGEVPDVPVGDPLTLAPLGLPDFGFDPSFAPSAVVDAAAPSATEAANAAAIEDALGSSSPAAELAVVVVLSVLLLAGAGIAQLQANRHQIPD